MFNKNALEYSLEVSKNFNKESKILKSYFGITNFGHLKLYYNNTYFYTCNNSNLIEDYICNINDTVIFLDKYIKSPTSDFYFLLWPTVPQHYSMDLYLKHKYWNGCTLLKFNKDNVELWWFASDVDNNAMGQFLIRHMHIFEKFIFYQKQKMYNNLHTISQKNLCTFSNGIDFSNLDAIHTNLFNETKQISLFLKKIHLNKFLITTLNGEATISKKELKCLEGIADGKIAKEIANSLRISSRTVETHINNIKFKTGFFTKSQLVKLYKEQLQKYT